MSSTPSIATADTTTARGVSAPSAGCALCGCGCGQPVKKSRRREPSKYLIGHSPIARRNLTNRKISTLAQVKAAEAFSKNPVMQKGTGHINGRPWQIRSPRGRIYRFKNLREFIRRNSELFDSQDTEWKKTPKGDLTCRAHTGIAGISIRLKNPRGSWKGWTWYSQAEKLFNGGACLLGRDDSEHNAKVQGTAVKPQSTNEEE